MAKKTKFILTVGDEGAILVYLDAGKVVRRLFAATPDYTNTRAMIECFEADPKAPIFMLVDVMDQSYIQQTLPPVSSLSVKNLIKRKMERDFAKEDLKGALQIGREKEGRRDWKYLFVTLSHSPQLQAWIDLIIDLPNAFKGIYLLPVEMENFIFSLRSAMKGKKLKKGKHDEGEAHWTLMVTHNKVGGFRQVVLKDDKLIFARLAQPIGDSKPDVIAGSIEQEVSVTIEYLKRLGYNPDQGLELFSITSDAIKANLTPSSFQASQVHLLTPFEASEHLKFEGVCEPNDQFADVVLSAAFARARGHLLKLETEQSKKLHQYNAAIMGARAFGGIAAVASLATVAVYGFQIPVKQSELEDMKQRQRLIQQRLDELKRIEETVLPEDLDQITEIVDLHSYLDDLGMMPTTTLAKLRDFLVGKNVLLMQTRWQSSETIASKNGVGSGSAAARGRGRAPQAAADTEEVVQPVELQFTLNVFETQRGTKGFNEYVQNELNPALREAFPDYAVRLNTGLPGIQEGDQLSIGLNPESIDPLLSQESFTLDYTLTMPKSAAGAQGGGA